MPRKPPRMTKGKRNTLLKHPEHHLQQIRAFSWMNLKRASGLVPINWSTVLRVEVSSASAISTLNSERFTGSHGGFLQLRRHHFTKPLEAADLDLLVAGEFRLHQFLPVGVITGIKRLATLRNPVERRDCQIQATGTDHIRHFLIKKT